MPETPDLLVGGIAPKPLERRFHLRLRTVPALKTEGIDFKKF